MDARGLLLGLLLVPGLAGAAHAHTVDAVGEYRIEIGWMNEPVVSNETNAIELYVSPLDASLELEEQGFKNGIPGLDDTLKLEIVFKTEKKVLLLSEDHDIPGKYYAFIDPTVSGFYQANLLGTILDTPISLSMHPPKVQERGNIEFPRPADITITQIIDGHTALIEDVHDLKDTVDELEQAGSSQAAGYAGIGLGAAGIAIAAAALARSKK